MYREPPWQKGLGHFTSLKKKSFVVCCVFLHSFRQGAEGKLLRCRAEALKVMAAPWTVTRVCSQQTLVRCISALCFHPAFISAWLLPFLQLPHRTADQLHSTRCCCKALKRVWGANQCSSMATASPFLLKKICVRKGLLPSVALFYPFTSSLFYYICLDFFLPSQVWSSCLKMKLFVWIQM